MNAAACLVPCCPIIEALKICAARGNHLAINALESIRRLEAGEPVEDESRERLEMILEVSGLEVLPADGNMRRFSWLADSLRGKVAVGHGKPGGPWSGGAA